MKAKAFLNRLHHDDIVAEIRRAELKTSGEIRVFISRQEPDDPIEAAQTHFTELGMHMTGERNAVLIFVAPEVRKFAVIGDVGVHARCGNEFWRGVAGEMSTEFKREEFTAAIIHGVRKAGDLLAQHFPRKPDDINELPDDIAHD